MSITKELREWIENNLFRTGAFRPPLLGIADRIDETHDKALLDMRNRGFDEGFACADDWYVEHALELAKHGWIKLPLDADVVAWYIGDRDENGYKVTSLKLTKFGWFYFANGMPNEAGEHRHHHPDTWESIITDAMRAGRADVAVDVMPLIKRCKAL